MFALNKEILYSLSKIKNLITLIKALILNQDNFLLVKICFLFLLQ